jgi:hypothetical protein
MSESKSSFYLCIKNRGYAASLQVRAVYRAISDPEAEAHSMLRIIDEFGEDYLFPASFFVPIEVPKAAEHAFAGAAPGLLETAHLLRSPKNAERLLTALQEARNQAAEPQTVEDLRREMGRAPTLPIAGHRDD